MYSFYILICFIIKAVIYLFFYCIHSIQKIITSYNLWWILSFWILDINFFSSENMVILVVRTIMNYIFSVLAKRFWRCLSSYSSSILRHVLSFVMECFRFSVSCCLTSRNCNHIHFSFFRQLPRKPSSSLSSLVSELLRY